MSIPSELNIALKEWDTVCRAMTAGRQLILLRKGGIYESAGGFEIENRQFLLFPTFLHQNPQMLKDDALPWYERRSAEPEQVSISAAGSITDIVQLTSRSQMDALDTQHVWTTPLIDMRFNYKPQNPLYLLLVRIYSLEKIVTLQNSPAYAGCKSWVPLDAPVQTGDAIAVLSDSEYENRRRDILSATGRSENGLGQE